MQVLRYELTLKNKAAIALAVVALMAVGAVVITIGMTLLVVVLGVAIVGGAGLALRAKVRNALGRGTPRRAERLDPELDPAREVFPSESSRAPRIRSGRDDG